MSTDNSAGSLAFRLKHFIEYTGLNTTTFADKCGIPRPSFSQILTGRNQKVSNLLIGKIHDAYPDLSLYWLMFGQGEMLVQSTPVQTEPEFNPDAPDMDKPVAPYTDVVIATSPLREQDISDNESQTQTRSNLSDRNLEELVYQLLDKQDEMGKILRELKAENDARKNCSPRKVASITIFYDDSSFETFIPGK